MPFRDLAAEIRNRPQKPRIRNPESEKKIIDASGPSMSEAISRTVTPGKSWKECRNLRMDGDNALCREFVSKCGREKCGRIK
ncbi:MAG: hypothetical protein WC308_00440 [archaeon]|jgi:hypothetical protein